MANDHKMVKLWKTIEPGKRKCCICEKAPATKIREYSAPSKIKAYKNTLTLGHCATCHKRHIPRRKH